jgi:hypothetical protein
VASRPPRRRLVPAITRRRRSAVAAEQVEQVSEIADQATRRHAPRLNSRANDVAHGASVRQGAPWTTPTAGSEAARLRWRGDRVSRRLSGNGRGASSGSPACLVGAGQDQPREASAAAPRLLRAGGGCCPPTTPGRKPGSWHRSAGLASASNDLGCCSERARRASASAARRAAAARSARLPAAWRSSWPLASGSGRTH